VGVPDGRDVVVGVEVGVTFRVVQVDTRAARKRDRLLVEQPVGAAKRAVAAADEFLGGGRQVPGLGAVEVVHHQGRWLGHFLHLTFRGRFRRLPERSG
jgi:hypothetical protein